MTTVSLQNFQNVASAVIFKPGPRDPAVCMGCQSAQASNTKSTASSSQNSTAVVSAIHHQHHPMDG